MRLPIKNCLILLLIIVSLTGCARRGSIMGGPRDSIAPSIRTSIPENFSTGFEGNEVRIVFDEYIRLKNINRQLVISPPMKNQPEILPMNATRQLTIRFRDTLQPNTTYSLNFGQSIEDNNEGNPLHGFKYVFSTGTYLDSLTLSGTIKDAFLKKPDNFVSVMLYEINETFSDSTIFRESPRYITNTLDSARTFRLENLKQGEYLLIALKDNNGNNRFEPASDKIAFHSEFVTVPNDTLYEMELFYEQQPFRALNAAQDSGNKIIVGYQGNPVDVKASVLSGGEIPSVVTKVPNKDSIHVWHRRVESDSLTLQIRKGDYSKDFRVRIKDQKTDSLVLSQTSPVLHLRNKLQLKVNTPIGSVNDALITLINKDSTAVPFTTTINNYSLLMEIDFDRQPLERYRMTLLPGAITDFYGRTNDTLGVNVSTRSPSDYGNLKLTLENVKKFPVIVQLTNDKGDAVESVIVRDNNPIEFMLIDPMLYSIRVIYDENDNGEWDSGNYLEKRQPEQVIYFTGQVDVRANWDVDQVFRLP